MDDLSLVSYALRAKNRVRIMSALKDGRKISAQLEKETGMYKSHISRTLQELKNKKIIRCVNPNDRAFRFYELTAAGRKVLSKAKEIKQSL